MRLNRFAFLSTVAGLAAALFAVPAHSQAQSIDDLVLAIVDGKKITRRDLVDRLMLYRADEAVDRTIGRRLVEQAARKSSIMVTDADVDERLSTIRQRFQSDDRYKQFLRTTGLREDQHRLEIRTSLLAERVALKDQPITDAEYQQYEVRLLIAKDKATAEKWLKEIEEGKFVQLAVEQNADISLRATGGRMRPFVRAELLDVADALRAQNVQPGNYTKAPVKLNEDRWAIIRLDSIVPVQQISASERERLTALLTRFHMDQWMEKAKSAAKVDRPASGDPIAIVNAEPIARAEIVAGLLEFRGEEELEQMIRRTLLVQAAAKAGQSVSSEEAEKKVAQAKAQVKSPQEFQEALAKLGVTEQQFKDDIGYNLLLERVVLKESPISDEDLNRYDARLLLAPDKKTAEAWVKELDNGADFTQMVKERSPDEQARATGGRLKPFLRIDLLDIWRAINAQNLKPGGYTRQAFLLTDDNWALLKLEAIIPITGETPAIRERLTNQLRTFRITQWLDQTRTAAEADGRVSRPNVIGPAVISGKAP